jgi:hypothetical protein
LRKAAEKFNISRFQRNAIFVSTEQNTIKLCVYECVYVRKIKAEGVDPYILDLATALKRKAQIYFYSCTFLLIYKSVVSRYRMHGIMAPVCLNGMVW